MKVSKIKSDIKIVEIIEDKYEKTRKDGTRADEVRHIMSALVKNINFGKPKTELIEIIYIPKDNVTLKVDDMVQVELGISAFSNNVTYRAIDFNKINK